MPQHHIVLDQLVKTYRVAERAPGLWGATRGVLHRRHRTVQALAGRVLVIGHGRVLAERRLVVDFAGPAPEGIALPGVAVHAREAQRLVLSFEPCVTTAPALIAHVAAAHAVQDIRLEALPIEEVITRFYALHGASE